MRDVPSSSTKNSKRAKSGGVCTSKRLGKKEKRETKLRPVNETKCTMRRCQKHPTARIGLRHQNHTEWSAPAIKKPVLIRSKLADVNLKKTSFQQRPEGAGMVVIWVGAVFFFLYRSRESVAQKKQIGRNCGRSMRKPHDTIDAGMEESMGASLRCATEKKGGGGQTSFVTKLSRGQNIGSGVVKGQGERGKERTLSGPWTSSLSSAWGTML